MTKKSGNFLFEATLKGQVVLQGEGMNAINAVKIDIIDPQANANNTAKQPAKIVKAQPQQAYVNASPGVMKVGDIPVSSEKMPAQYAQYALLPKPDKNGKMTTQVVKIAPESTIKAKADDSQIHAYAPNASPLANVSGYSYGPYATIPDPYLAPYLQDPTMFSTTDPYTMYPQQGGGTSLTMPYIYPPLPGHYPGDIYI